MNGVRLAPVPVVALAVLLGLAGCGKSSTEPAEPRSDAAILALKPAGTNALIVKALGYGSGSFALSEPGLTCATWDWEDAVHYAQVCWAFVPVGTASVTVTAAPTNGSRFTGWGAGPCTGSTDASCTVPMDRDRIVSVGFWPGGAAEPKSEYALSVHVLGFVDGEITAPPGVGLVCQESERVGYARTCVASVPATTPATQVTLTATPTVPGTEFAGWGGSCSGAGACTVTMDRDRSVTASFARPSVPQPPAGLSQVSRGIDGTVTGWLLAPGGDAFFSVRATGPTSAEANYEISDGVSTPRHINVRLQDRDNAFTEILGEVFSGYGALSQSQVPILVDLLTPYVLRAIQRVPLEIGCDDGYFAPAELAALTVPWQLALKYLIPDRVVSVSRAASAATCSYGIDDSAPLRRAASGALQIGDGSHVPNVLGFAPFDAYGSVELAWTVIDTSEAPCGATCRGACGRDCAPSNCMDGPAVGPTCHDGLVTATTTQVCGTHQGCVLHDACFDTCNRELGCNTWESEWVCKMQCNAAAEEVFGLAAGVLWASGRGPFSGHISFNTTETKADASCTACGSANSCGGTCDCPVAPTGSWVPVDNPAASTVALLSVWGESSTRVWLGGTAGTILLWDGTSWVQESGGNNYNAIWGTPGGTFWLFGDLGHVYQCSPNAASPSGASCVEYWGVGTQNMLAGWGSSPDDVWAVDIYGQAWHWNGANWGGPGGGRLNGELRDDLWQYWPLRGVWGSSAADVWTVGYNGGVFHWNGSAWLAAARKTTSDLTGVWGSSPDDVWAVGTGGTILRWDGVDWAPVESTTTNDLKAVWGSSSTDVWVVGANGTILHWGGSGWSSVASGTTMGLRAVWGTGPQDVWAVGDGGTILRYSP